MSLLDVPRVLGTARARAAETEDATRACRTRDDARAAAAAQVRSVSDELFGNDWRGPWTEAVDKNRQPGDGQMGGAKLTLGWLR